MRALAGRLDRALRESTDRLIAIHGLEGRAAGEVLARLAEGATPSERIDEGKAAMLGGIVSGALSGLAADLASGGLTLGAGMLAGGLLGALGGGAIARGYNVARGTDESVLRWGEPFLESLIDGALLRYLAVAHYGRGRGEWKETEYPPFWRDVVRDIAQRHVAQFRDAWAGRVGAEPAALARTLRPVMRRAAIAVLDALYPGSLRIAEAAGRSPSADPGSGDRIPM
jgi:hypothetical protein